MLIKKMTQKIKAKNLFYYSFLALPIAFSSLPLYIHAPDFYATRYNVSLSYLGFILLGLRFIDAVQDPLIGRLSDEYNSHRYKIMFISALLMVFAFILVFTPLINSLLIWFAITMFLATSAYSVLSINLNALGGLWSRDPHIRTKITSFRESFTLIGLILAFVLPNLFANFIDERNVFLCVGLALMLFVLIGLFLFYSWYQKTSFQIEPSSKKVDSFYHFFKMMHFETKRFFQIFTLSMFASSIPALLVLFFIRDRLNAEHLVGLFLLIYFVAAAFSMPLWRYLSNKYSKYRAWLFSMFLASLTFIWVFFLKEGDVLQYALICTFTGFAFGADLALPPSILADFIHHDHSEKEASTTFSLLAFLTKLSLALATVLIFPYLDYFGFKPNQINTEESLLSLRIVYGLVPCFIKIISGLLLWKNLALYEKENENEDH
jgi:GPH family glycoside/pentoside/hexuronide:cation symporter